MRLGQETEIDDPIKAGIHLNDELTSHGQEVNLTNHIPYKELKDLSDGEFANMILKYAHS